jgi:uncharacterized RDD family membrane protein YckC
MMMINADSHNLVRATPCHRIAAVAVDIGLSIVTLNIGWFIWNLIVMAKGQSPGKQILKVRVLSAESKQPATWGHMAIRQFLIPLTTSIFFFIPQYLLGYSGFSESTTPILVLTLICFATYIAIWVIDLVWLFTRSNRRLLDYWAKTIVVNEAK